MSRIGKKPVAIPAGVSVKVLPERKITVESSGKKLEMTHRPEVSVVVDDAAKSVVIAIDEKDHDNREVRAYWGSTRAHINNMVAGVTKGYEKVLEVNGVGWGATLAGNKLNLKLGYANILTKMIPAGVNVAVEKNQIKISGPDKQAVGQFAAEVRALRKPEPYNGKGIKYLEEVIKRKEGKAFGS
ncbi:MAG: 50S ribosomal protein L6 [Phycisphaeraceae bacterium]|nr:50S ribosomal protein L6 [Phycisphaeraceae bacterium]